MKVWIGLATASLLFVVQPAHADPSSPDPPAPSDESPRNGAPRLRLGFAGTLSGAVGEGTSKASEKTSGFGASADAGLQWGDAYAFYVRGEVGPFTTHAAGYAVAEWSPLDWVSLGTGIGVDWIQNDAATTPYGAAASTWTGASIPVIVGFNVGSRSPSSARRSVFRIGVEAAPGIDAKLSPGYHWAIALGWTRM